MAEQKNTQQASNNNKKGVGGVFAIESGGTHFTPGVVSSCVSWGGLVESH